MGRISQTDKALTALRTLVLTGAFEPGEKLSEIALSARIGISRTPLREALGRLVEEGLLERVPSGGCQVSSYTMQDIVDAIEFRGTVEGLAARLAAERGVGPAALTDANILLEGIDAALVAKGGVDFPAYVRLNAAFHDWIAEAAGSAVLSREAVRAARLPLTGPSAFLTRQESQVPFLRSLEVAQYQHRALLEAIEAGEGGRAEAVAREHARLARRNLQAAVAARDTMTAHIPGLALVAPD
ncbi:GntR family transcriptional regulator [Rhodobacterales bacterium HKCCE2091]|nr:GntR family transcriptional regulator [Rhodobacterales bacterium HKCCE2091]